MHWKRAKIILEHDIQEWECSACSHDTNHLIQQLGLYERGLDEALGRYHIFTGIYANIKYIAIWKKHRYTDPMHVHWLFESVEGWESYYPTTVTNHSVKSMFLYIPSSFINHVNSATSFVKHQPIRNYREHQANKHYLRSDVLFTWRNDFSAWTSQFSGTWTPVTSVHSPRRKT